MKKLLLSLVLAAGALFATSAAATDRYFCENGTGSAPGVVPGNESNDGLTSSTPKRLTATLVAAWGSGLAGDRIKLCDGGAWDGVNITSEPRGAGVATLIANNLVLERYSTAWSSAKPRLNGVGNLCPADYSSQNCHVFAMESGTAFGGYTIDGILFDGGGCVGCTAINVRFNVSNITIINTTVQNFQGGMGCQELSGMFPHDFTYRNNLFQDISGMGLTSFGCSNVLVEANTFIRVSNGAMPLSDKYRDHPLYISGIEANQGFYATNVTVRYNNFYNWGHGANDIGNPNLCAAPAIVGHGLIRGWTFEYNTFRNDAGTAQGNCWGLAISAANNEAGKDEKEFNVTMRGNRFFNVGSRPIEMTACDTCMIEDNLIVYETTVADFIGITVRESQNSLSPKYPNSNITIRNNGIWVHGCNDTCVGVSFLPAAGTNHTFYGNTLTWGAGSTTGRTCWEVAAASTYGGGWDNNHCYNFNAWSNTHSTRSAFASARSQDVASVECAPAFTNSPPTSANNANMIPTVGSCLIGAGHSTKSSPTTAGGRARGSPPDIGPFQAGRDVNPAAFP